VEEGEMPLNSYTLIHKHAVLSPEQISSLKEWAKLEMEKIIVP
jgi:Haem-binding domain